jgi:TonB family protein
MMSIMHKNTNQLFAVSASVFIHAALGFMLVPGLFNDLRLLPSLNTSATMWVSLESGSENAAISPQGKRADGKKFQKAAIITINATKNIPVDSYSVKEGGVAQATSTMNSTNDSDSTAGHSSAFVTASPLYRENTPPVYPALAKLRGYEGVVLVNAEILPDGRVGSMAVSKSSGYTILDNSAMEAVKLWKFEPAKNAGKPFAVRVKLPIKFVLHDDDNSRS